MWGGIGDDCPPPSGTGASAAPTHIGRGGYPSCAPRHSAGESAAFETIRWRAMSAFEHLLTSWDGEQVAVRYDADFATWMFIGVHSTRDGRSGGGTRMAVYAQPEDALADALK